MEHINTLGIQEILPGEILAALQRDISEIKVALLGNEYNPAGGLLSRTALLEAEIERIKSKYDRIMWTVAGGGAVIAIVFNLIMAFFDKFMYGG